MTDDSGSTTYKYDARGRLIEEKRNIDSVDYTTQYTYDSADRVVTITYPTGETVTQTYNGRGFPYTLSGSVAGNIVNTTYYNQLGEPTELNLQNGVKTIFGYYGTGGAYDTTGGYYGRLWQIKSTQGANVRQEMRHTWDASGNLAWRQDVKFGGLEYCTYDFLDRLTSVSSAYSHSYSYDEIGNIVTFNGTSYTYGSKPHAVTDAGDAEYTYDDNGNMVDRDGTTITWNVENRPTAVGSATFVYDGDGNRVKKTEGGQTTIYVNKYYEKNTGTGTVTTYYYLGDRLVALRNGSNLRYVHQDHLGGTNVVTNSSGSQLGYTRYFPYGSTRDSSGSLDTDKEFTGQRLDGTGLYYYNARYYDSTLGRFISTDPIVQGPSNPQSWNPYSYVSNNPLKYIDPLGLAWIVSDPKPPTPNIPIPPPIDPPSPPSPDPIGDIDVRIEDDWDTQAARIGGESGGNGIINFHVMAGQTGQEATITVEIQMGMYSNEGVVASPKAEVILEPGHDVYTIIFRRYNDIPILRPYYAGGYINVVGDISVNIPSGTKEAELTMWISVRDYSTDPSAPKRNLVCPYAWKVDLSNGNSWTQCYPFDALSVYTFTWRPCPGPCQ